MNKNNREKNENEIYWKFPRGRAYLRNLSVQKPSECGDQNRKSLWKCSFAGQNRYGWCQDLGSQFSGHWWFFQSGLCGYCSGCNQFSGTDAAEYQACQKSKRGRVQSGGLSASEQQGYQWNVSGAAWICGKGKESVTVPAAQKSFRGRQGICKGIQIQQCGKNRASRICRRSSGAYLKRYQALWLLYQLLSDD